jgi:hypothetical protein
MRIWVKGLGVTLLVSAVACSSSGGGGGSVTSIPGSTALNTLTPAQATQLCTDTSAYVSRSITKSDACKLAGFTTAALSAALGAVTTDQQAQAACQAAVDSCNNSSSDAGTTGTCSIGDTSTCVATATVSEYSTCISDDVTAVKGSFASIPACSALTIASLTSADAGTGGTTTTPASCTKLSTDCPGLTIPGL